MYNQCKTQITVLTETMETETILTSENRPSMVELLHTSLIKALLNNDCNFNSTNNTSAETITASWYSNIAHSS